MDAITLLNDELCDLPRAGTGIPFGESLLSATNLYCEAVASLTAQDYASTTLKSHLPAIRDLGHHLLAAHSAALAGQPGTARDAMHSAMASANQHLNVLKSKPVDQDGIGPLFRVRRASMNAGLDRSQVFHIPYDMRHRVGPQRYSMPGVPMLYLSSSIYTCWEELGRAELDDFWVSSLKLAPDTAVVLLDLGHRPALMAALINAHGSKKCPLVDLAIAHASLWPLLAACSFVRTHPDGSFVEEYVIPQLLTAYLVETREFDGIRYFSSRVTFHGADLLTTNFVFPSDPGHALGYCPKLSSLFRLSAPLPWSMVRVLGPGLNRGHPLVRGRQGVIDPFGGHRVEYPHTDFALVEAHILEMPHEPV